jgi:hypothetical protein
MDNNLFIGLGGTGCAVVREFKKLLFAEWRRKGGIGECPDLFEFKDQFSGKEEQVRIATLSIDSNKGDLEGQHDKWRVLGEQLNLKDNEKVLITPQGLGNVLGNLKEYPGIEPWVGNERSQMDKIIRGTEQPAGCNQIRRLGRLALANGNNLQNVLNAVNSRRTALTKGSSLDMALHIACTLGCGTGSGIVVDLITQLRRALSQEPGNYPIYLYVFVTSSNVGAVNTGNFYANQYAALQELNAIRLGLYKPWDISASKGQARLIVNDPFESVFIITDATESGQGLTLGEQVNSAAEFVFQKLVRLMGNIPNRLAKAHTFEDVSPYSSDEPESDRSTRFASFGVKRFAIPEQEIHEKLAYTFVEQGILRVLYDNWSGRDGQGYIDVAKPLSDDGFVETRKAKWGLTMDHLNWNVDRPDQADEPYPQFLATWQAECEQLAADVQATYPKNSEAWVAELDVEVDQFWRNGFRNKGVEAYFAVRSEANALVTRARKLAESVEQDLLQGMENLTEEYQAHHFPAIIRRAKSHLEIASKKFSQELKELTAQIEGSLEDRDRNRDELQNVGAISKAMGKHLNIFGAYQKATQDYYFLETCRIAAEHALKLIEHAIPEFGKLEDRSERFVKKLKKLREDHSHLVNNRIVEKEGLPDDFNHEVVNYVNAKEVNESIAMLRMDVEKQKSHALALTSALRLLRRAGDGFERYNDLAPEEKDGKVGGKVATVIQEVAFPSSREAHDQKKLSDSRFVSILGQNIIEKLYKDYGGRTSGDLEAKIRKLMDVAMPAVAFDGTAMPLGHTGVPSPIFGRSVFMPECESVEPAFRTDLKRLISGMTGGGHGGVKIEVEVADVPAKRNATELVFLSVAYFFPLRMLKAVKGLHSELEKRLVGSEEEAKFQIYGETHTPPLPSLMRPDETARRLEALPYVLLADLQKLIHVPDSVEGSEPLLVIAELSAAGRAVDPIPLEEIACTQADREMVARIREDHGAEIPLSLLCLIKRYQKTFRMTNLRRLQERVGSKLSEVRTPDKKAVLVAQLEAMLDQIFIACNKREDETYRYFSNAIQAAKKLVDSSGK